MKAQQLVKRMLESDDPDEMSAKSELMGLPGWKEQLVREDQFDYLTDRWGDPQEMSPESEEVVALLHQLGPCMGDRENSFVVKRKSDGQFGVMFETEFENPENEKADLDDDNAYLKAQFEAGITEESVAKSLLGVVYKLEKQFPQIQFSVTVGEHVFANQFAVRGFVPASVATPQLGTELAHIFSVM